jgi:hypothetical protein
MARSKRHATRMGIMGAVLGAINFKVSQSLQQLAEEAEMRKLQRLEQIQIAREGRAEQRDVAKDERTFAQQEKMLDSSQQHDVALAGLRNEFDTQRLNQQLAAQREMNASDNAAALSRQELANRGALEVANVRSADSGDGLYGSDGQWYPRGTALPAGVTPAVGFGATNLGVRGSGGLPGRPGAAAPAPRRDFTGFSVTPAD